MTDNHTEQLIRDAFTDEADRAVDGREVLAAVRGRRPRRSYGLVLATAAVVVVVAAVATFVVPEVFRRGTPPATGQEQTTAVTPTNVLVVGIDTVGYTDSIVLTQVAEDGSVSLVSLPKDSWVEVPGGKMARLNQVYHRSGAEALLSAVGNLTGVTVEHYAVVDMAAIGDLTNALGGVPVCLLAPTSDWASGAEFSAGQQTVSGPAALAFLRQRRGLPNSDLDRMVRLQAFLQGLAVRMRAADPSAVVNAVKGRVKTDPNLDLLGLAGDLTRAKELRVGTIPIVDSAHMIPDTGSVVSLDPADVRQYVTDIPGTPPVSGDVPCVN